MSLMRIKPLVVVVILGIGQLSGNAGGWSDADDQEGVYSAELASLQTRLRAAGVGHVALDKAELQYAVDQWDGISPHTVLANNRTHLLSSQFVENDPRREMPENTITYLVDQSDGSALSITSLTPLTVILLPNAVTEPQLDASMAAWNDFSCNGPNVAKIADPGSDPDVVDNLVSNTTPGTPFADITHAGWLPNAFFTAVFPGSGGILAATFTFVFLEDDGVTPTDIDRDGRADVAFREIYYNRGYGWGTGGDPFNIDIQSVAIHESGHGFGLAHFGKITLKADGRFQFSPKAIMNAAYVSEDRRILGADTASFCQAWARR